VAIPGLQRITSLSLVLRGARDTHLELGPLGPLPGVSDR
jgi:hypothetical protein